MRENGSIFPHLSREGKDEVMSLLRQKRLSDEDHRLINVNRIGKVLRVFWLNRKYIFILYTCIFLLQIIAFALLFAVISYFRLIIAKQLDISFIAVGIVMILGIVLCESISLIYLPNEQKMYLIVCETGLLQIKKLFRGTQVDVIYWREIASVEKGAIFMLEHQIIYQDKKKVFPLFIGYQHYNELINIIREQSTRTT